MTLLKKSFRRRCFLVHFFEVFKSISFMGHGIQKISPEENCPPVRVGVWVTVRLIFRVGGNQTIASEEH